MQWKEKPLLSNQFPSSLNSQNDLWYSQHCLQLSQCGFKACQGWLWTEAPSCLCHPRERTFCLWGQCLSKKYYSRVISFCLHSWVFYLKINEYQEILRKLSRQSSLWNTEFLSPTVLWIFYDEIVLYLVIDYVNFCPNRVYFWTLDAILQNYEFDKLSDWLFSLENFKGQSVNDLFHPLILVLHILMVSELMVGEQGHFCFLLSVRWKLASGFR